MPSLTVNRRQAKEEKARRILQRDFTRYKWHLYKRYQHPLHLDVLDKALMQVIRYVETGGKEGIWFLLSEMPPRHGKTLTLSRLLPPWFLGRNPDKRVMGVSYGATLAHKNSRLARNLMLSPWYRAIFPQVQLDPSSQAADAWNLFQHEGGMDAMGILGGATGKGAHLLLLDDLLKNRQEAESEIIRERVWDAITDDLLTRLEPGGAGVLNATRWHMDDPHGRFINRLMDLYPGKVMRLRFPAIAEVNDPLGRIEGSALWKERYPIERLLEIQATMGEYSWSALYQQNPVPAEGGIFKRKWFEPYLDTTPNIVYAVRYWDLAMSEKTSADYTVGIKLGQGEDGHFYILDVARRQIDWGNLTEWIAQIILADGPSVAQGLEEKGYMSRAIQDLNADPRLHGYEIWGYPVDTDKLTRALPFAAKCGAGLVHLLNRHWTPEYVDELCSFPQGVYDDQVDASSGAWAMIGESIATEAGYMNSGQAYTITQGY